MKKVLSIAIPSYNVDKYLKETLDSIANCKNLEYLNVLIIDDGSQDKTGEIADHYAQKYNPYITVIHKKNAGHGSTINTALENAKGTYFLVIDGDDWVDSEKLDSFLEFIQTQDEDLIITGHYRNYILEGREEKYFYREKKGFKCNLEYLLEKNYIIPMTDTCYKISLLRKIDLKIQENTFYVDEEFCSFPYQIIKSICFFGEGFYHYRIGDINQSISIENSLRRITHKERVLENIYNILFLELEDKNREYILRKLAGIANSILMLHYVYQSNKKEGRIRGKEYYKKIINNYKLLIPRCRRVNYIFYLMNIFSLGEKQWNLYQKLKYKLRRGE
ncbi:glycosyltransferase family 2 protein [Fusobacterium perfoetens]|uniref:glycosyltransferase family 2 protein n=1 Tax=Fusobacterium perfoetens TaxID=852 RepID=UPI0026EA19AF|nr:glycosyltransferase family 2 protein [Fusobacterium perfoetens]